MAREILPLLLLNHKSGKRNAYNIPISKFQYAGKKMPKFEVFQLRPYLHHFLFLTLLYYKHKHTLQLLVYMYMLWSSPKWCSPFQHELRQIDIDGGPLNKMYSSFVMTPFVLLYICNVFKSSFHFACQIKETMAFCLLSTS